jgi:hypothetical protein
LTAKVRPASAGHHDFGRGLCCKPLCAAPARSVAGRFDVLWHAEVVTLRARFKLLGDGWAAYGGHAIPDDRIIEVSQEEAASFLHRRGSGRALEFLGWVEDPATLEDEQPDR